MNCMDKTLISLARIDLVTMTGPRHEEITRYIINSLLAVLLPIGLAYLVEVTPHHNITDFVMIPFTFAVVLVAFLVVQSPRGLWPLLSSLVTTYEVGLVLIVYGFVISNPWFTIAGGVLGVSFAIGLAWVEGQYGAVTN